MHTFPHRILIVGAPGSGKTTFSKILYRYLCNRYGARLNKNFVLTHMDKLLWEEGWIQRKRDVFLKDLEEASKHDAWIIEGVSIRGLVTLFSKCDLVIIMKKNPWICLFRVTKRTLLSRIFSKNKIYPLDKVKGNKEKMDGDFVKYLWVYPRKLTKVIHRLKMDYPHVKCIQVSSEKDIDNLKNEIEALPYPANNNGVFHVLEDDYEGKTSRHDIDKSRHKNRSNAKKSK